MKIKSIIKFNLFVVLIFIEIASISGCTEDPYMLGITGYNYTDRAVADFSVDSVGGGNVDLSTSTDGGGGFSCCAVLGRNTRAPFWIDVVYQMDALVSYSTRKEVEAAGPYIKARIKVEGPIPPDPAYLEIHFYRDHIEAAISGRDGPSPPRLKLNRRLPFIR